MFKADKNSPIYFVEAKYKGRFVAYVRVSKGFFGFRYMGIEEFDTAEEAWDAINKYDCG